MNIRQLREFAPGGDTALLTAIASSWGYAEGEGINTPLRICHFLATLFVESAGLRRTEENLRYSQKRLMAVWPKHFPDIAVASKYAYDPEKIANKVYGGRLGNVNPGDGWKFRGRGLIQLTGRDNYRRIGRRIGVDLEKEPDLLSLDPEIGFRAAVAFWMMADCNGPADRNDIRALRRKVNGGYHGLADVRAAFRQAAAIWGDGSFSEIGAKGPFSSNIGRASLIGGAGVIGGIAEQASEISGLVASGRSIFDALGGSLPMLLVLLLIAGVIVYVLRDRIFIAEHEGL